MTRGYLGPLKYFKTRRKGVGVGAYEFPIDHREDKRKRKIFRGESEVGVGIEIAY